MVRKLLSILLTACVLSASFITDAKQVSAESGKKELEEVRDQQKKSEGEIEKIQDMKVEIQKELAKVEQEITKLDQQIGEINKKIEANQTYLEKHEKSFGENLRRMYLQGDGTHLAHLFSVDSFSRFLERFEVMRILMKEQANELNVFVKAKMDLEKNKKELEEKKKAQSELLKQSEAKVKEIEAQLQKHQAELNKLEAKEKELMQKYAGSGGGGGILAFPSTRGTVYWNFSQNRGTHIHAGIDIPRPVGTPIYAAESGVVQLIKSNPGGYGIYVIINHGNGLSTLYAHMYRYQVNVSVGQRVSRGQQIAAVGNNGRSTGPHLHFEVHKNGTPVNPRNYIQ